MLTTTLRSLPLKTAVFFLVLVAFGNPCSAQGPYPHDTRSDSVDIRHYNIHLDVRAVSTQTLKGHTQVIFKPLVDGIDHLALDLIGLDVDSVKNPAGNLLTFVPQGMGFNVDLGTTFNTGDSTSIEVFYHGAPVLDPSFGGFYFTNTYIFNVGVSLTEIPHNYGRTWFPCFDNFTTRSTYDFFVTTLPQYNVVCGGVFQSMNINPDLSETHHWRINQTIPSYLASTATANYVFIDQTFSNYQGNPVPVQLAALAADTADLSDSFVNLENAFDIFEEQWGPYRWDRVGYALMPITAGAMEHAMNIAFPVAAANGNLDWQSTMAHELSHHWWGNLVTCRTAEDMWINEGSAVYSEYVFAEQFTDRAAYEALIRNNHKTLLRTCHITDDGYWPVSGVPQEYTYSTTTYTKGADMIHTLRGYLGDAVFFDGLQQLLEQNQFSDIDAVEYRDDLSGITGMNLDNFFADWIFQGGWPHVSIDSLSILPSGPNYTVTVHLKQKLVGRSNFSHEVPLTLTLRDASWNTFEQRIFSSGETNTVTVTVPFLPTVSYLNRDELISHAVTGSYETITTTGTKQLSHANLVLQVQSVSDSAFVVAEQHWAAPDPMLDLAMGYTLSPQRFWRIDGIWDAGFTTNATFRYSGQTVGGTGYLDHLLLTANNLEDSLLLLYRPDRSVDWAECTFYTKVMGSATDKTGEMRVTGLRKGEYTFALKGQHVGIAEATLKTVRIHPNPASGNVTIESLQPFDALTLTDMQGRTVLVKHLAGLSTQIETGHLPKGTYLVSGFSAGKQCFNEKLVVW